MHFQRLLSAFPAYRQGTLRTLGASFIPGSKENENALSIKNYRHIKWPNLIFLYMIFKLHAMQKITQNLIVACTVLLLAWVAKKCT